MAQTEKTAPSFIAYHVVEKDGDNAFWTRIGAAWKHQDGEGLTVNLELLPVGSGRIVLRTPQAKPEKASAAA